MQRKISTLFLILFFITLQGYSQADTGWKWRYKLLPSERKPFYSPQVHYLKTSFIIRDFDNNLYCVDKLSGKQNWLLPNEKGVSVFTRIGNPGLIVGRDRFDDSADKADTREQLRNAALKSEYWLIDPSSGKILRQINDEKEPYANFEVFGDTLIRTLRGNKLKAFDLKTGDFKWENLECANSFGAKNFGNLILSNSKSGFCAINLSNGKLHWRIANTGHTEMEATHLGRIILANYQIDSNSQLLDDSVVLQAVDAKSGKKVWQSVKFEGIDSPQFTTKGNTLFVNALNADKLMAINTLSGKVTWTYGKAAQPYSGGFNEIVFHDNFILCPKGDGSLLILDKLSGRLVDTLKIANSSLDSTIVVDGYAYIASSNLIHKVDLRTGEIIWKFSAYGYVTGLIHENGILYFESLEGSYNAIDLSELERLSKEGRFLGTQTPDSNSLKRPVITIGEPN